MTSAERERVEGFGRLEDGLRQAGDWYLWGPYLSERQWGTVREDYSADGDAWDLLPARPRPVPGLPVGRGRHGRLLRRRAAAVPGAGPVERARPDPQGADVRPDRRRRATTGRTSRSTGGTWTPSPATPGSAGATTTRRPPSPTTTWSPRTGGGARSTRSTSCSTPACSTRTGTGSSRSTTPRPTPTDLLMVVRVTNAGPGRRPRCTCCPTAVVPQHLVLGAWTRPGRGCAAGPTASVAVDHPFLGDLELLAGAGPDGVAPTALFCENETNTQRLFGVPGPHALPQGRDQRPRRATGRRRSTRTGAAPRRRCWYRLAGRAGGNRRAAAPPAAGRRRRRTGEPAGARRRASTGSWPAPAEADAFYAELTPAGRPADEARGACGRRSPGCCGASSSTPTTWPAGWTATRASRPRRVPRGGRNAHWRHFDAFDIMSMPDPWEYPWFAAWDLAFHCVALAHVDPAFAKYQLLLLCREWFMHPNGALPAYEWDFGDVNPPVHAWAALEVFAIDGARDLDFLGRVFHKLLVNFTWWVNRKDADGNNLFEGGFLGLDNIGPLDRSHLPVGGILEQSDATGWMALYALAMAAIASILNRSGQRPALDLVLKFLEHFAQIRQAMDTLGVWDDADGFFYDQLVTPDGTAVPVKVRSMVGVIPAAGRRGDRRGGAGARQGAGAGVRPAAATGWAALSTWSSWACSGASPATGGCSSASWASEHLDQAAGHAAGRARVPVTVRPAGPLRLPPRASLRARGRRRPGRDRLRAGRVDHRDVRRQLQLARAGVVPAQLPADQRARALPPVLRRRAHRRVPDGGPAGHPRQGRRRPAPAAHRPLPRRAGRAAALLRLGRPPPARPRLERNLLFHEYFHGDNGAGLGASHQTGWTGLVADLIRGRPGDGVYAMADLVRVVDERTRP